MGADVPNVLDANADMLQLLVNQPLPDAVDMIIWRGSTNAEQAGPFERFAARLLIEAGAARILRNPSRAMDCGADSRHRSRIRS